MNAQMKACWNRRFSVGAPNSRNEGVPGIAGFRWEASVGGFRCEICGERFSVGAPCFSRGSWTSVQRKSVIARMGFSPGNSN
jgi:hypothetical protein